MVIQLANLVIKKKALGCTNYSYYLFPAHWFLPGCWLNLIFTAPKGISAAILIIHKVATLSMLPKILRMNQWNQGWEDSSKGAEHIPIYYHSNSQALNLVLSPAWLPGFPASQDQSTEPLGWVRITKPRPSTRLQSKPMAQVDPCLISPTSFFLMK